MHFDQALVTIKSNTILLSINIGQRILEATESFSSIESDIAKCNLSIIGAVATQASNAGRAIVNCINEKSGATTESSSSTAAWNKTIS